MISKTTKSMLNNVINGHSVMSTEQLVDQLKYWADNFNEHPETKEDFNMLLGAIRATHVHHTRELLSNVEPQQLDLFREVN